MIKKPNNTLPVGYRLHQYRIESVLGAGGFGITYKAVHEALQTRAAIKEYFPVEWSYRDRDEVNVLANTQGGLPTSEAGEDACYSWGLERFLNEAQILAKVNHSGVVRVRDFFEENGTAYIVMDYEDGEPLSQTLQREKNLIEDSIRRLLGDVLPALEAVHALGYLHRDIKPANLYRRADGRTILIDFGAARQALGRRSKSVTSVFSPGYSPIEQYLTEGKGYGPWTDIYALGAVLYHCVAGVAPIEAPGRVLDDPLRLAEELASGRYSQGLLRLIDRAMAVRPEKRFQTVAQMRTALEARMDDDGERTVKLELPLRSDLHRSGEKPRLVIVDPPKTPLKSRRLDWRWGVGILAVLAIAGGGIAIWKGQVPSTQVEQPSHPLASLKHSGPPASPQPGQIYADPGTGLDFVWVPPGCFIMGSPDTEKDRSANEVPHQVCLKGFWMGKTEVTNAQYQQFDPGHDSGAYESYSLNAPNQPVVRVSWQEAVAYADKLSDKSGLRFRLPTEAEWEYAARAGNTHSRTWGDDPNQACRYANIYDETARKTKPFNWANYPCEDKQVVVAPVGQYEANAFGLYDMLGNVAEWTCSEYDNAYTGSETRCADRKVAAGGQRVLRGGSWSDSPRLVRFAYRFPVAPELRKFDLGFRLVLEP
ncbi:bifunctional serine/threonine-protein kinase/formylglycine-generating enzyme family protein [Candidatus Contendibacter odensensis]|uniref:Calcium/calmodulin-dependent protein kinase n=1 Tax=Candidatus Contendobacter odensis Run_B_J11 TaxID=1400861 RepID=A0A7U7GF29_9GAMM|nr:bifunctional serine/threonine-protein kinase/formylglycine-generating enzyme family protein [Candidatus Contendobacter odensis]CDH47089.1 putative Calcium/calmodulin-dependent protein kinase [Candidatus Contendobacter odensis Run_B_J11]